MKKRILSALLALLLALPLLSAAAEPLPWLAPWLNVNKKWNQPLEGAMTFSLDADGLTAMYNAYMDYLNAFYGALLHTDDAEPDAAADQTARIPDQRDQICTQVRAACALLNALTLEFAGVYPQYRYDVLLSGESIVQFFLVPDEDGNTAILSNLFPSYRIAYPMPAAFPEGYAEAMRQMLTAQGSELTETQQVVIESLEQLLTQITNGSMQGLIHYHVPSGIQDGTRQTLEALEAKGLTQQVDGALRYEGSLLDFCRLLQNGEVPYAPLYSELLMLHIPALNDYLTKQLTLVDEASTQVARPVMISVEYKDGEARWELTVEHEISFYSPLVWDDDDVVVIDQISMTSAEDGALLTNGQLGREGEWIVIQQEDGSIMLSLEPMDEIPSDSAESESEDWMNQIDGTMFEIEIEIESVVNENFIQRYSLSSSDDCIQFTMDQNQDQRNIIRIDASAADEILFTYALAYRPGSYTAQLFASELFASEDEGEIVSEDGFVTGLTQIIRLIRTDDGQAIIIPSHFKMSHSLKLSLKQKNI